jgi:N-acetylmuramoyl-L-alanine amidase
MASRILTLLLFVLAAISASAQSKNIKTIIVDAGHGGKDFGAYGSYEGGLRSYEKNVTLGISNKLVAELRRQLPDVKIIPTRTTDIYQSPPEKAEIANSNKGDLFICIHADAVELKTGKRQIGTRQETRYKVTYTGKGKKKKKVSTPYTVSVPVYEYFKLPCQRNGTSVWLFAAHKTSEKLKALMKNEEVAGEAGEEEYAIENQSDSTYDEYNKIDFAKPEYRMMARVHMQRYQDKSIKLAELVNEEVEKTGRDALGVNQRQKGIWVLQATNMPAILIETGFICNYDDEHYLNSEKGQQELALGICNAVKRYKEQIEGVKGASARNQQDQPAGTQGSGQ